MYETLLLTVRRLAVLFIFIGLGFLFARRKWAGEGASKALARLLVCLFMPALCFRTFAANFTPAVFREKWSVIAIGFALTFAAALAAGLLARVFAHNDQETAVLTYCFTIPNYGYLGYPLIEGVFGEEALFIAMLITIAFNFYNYTIGFSMLTSGNGKITLRSLLNPNTVLMLLGIAVGLSGLTLPSVIGNAVDMAADCMAPVGLFLVGMIVARVPLKTLFNEPRMYLISVVRLLVMPALFGVVLYFFGMEREAFLVAVVLVALPLGTNSAVVPEAYGGETAMAAKACLLSHLMGLVTIPLIVWILSMLPG